MEHSASDLVVAAGLLGVPLTDSQAEQLRAQLDLLQRWNRTHNLVGPGSPDEWVERHTLDSLAAARFLPAGAGFDVGSGAGFPGIPIAVARPDCQVTLVEPREKRAAFLSNAVATLGLRNATVVRKRLEPARGLGNARFALSRATLPLPAWLTLAEGLVAPLGLVVAFLGLERWDQDRLDAVATKAGFVDVEVEPYQIGSQPKRTLALFRCP